MVARRRPDLRRVASAVIVLQPLLTPRVESLDRPRLVAQIRSSVPGGPGRRRSRSAGRELAFPAAERRALGVGRPRASSSGHDARAAAARRALPRGARARARVPPSPLEGPRLVRPARVPPDVPARAARRPAAAACGPTAVFVGLLLVLAVTPIANAVSRRYEAEADWVGLRTARDPQAATRLFVALAAAGKRDPTPPEPYTLVFGTHPPILDRIAMAEAFRARSGRRSRGGS